MNEAVDRKSAILFVNTDFNGVTDFSEIVTSLLAVCDCKAFSDFIITDTSPDDEYYDHFRDDDWLPDVQTDRQYDVQFLDLANSIFYEDAEIENVFRFLDLHNTRFKEVSYIDGGYLQITKGRVFRRINEDRRLVDDESHSLQELYRSCDNGDQEGKKQLFLSLKTVEREYTETWRKTGYYLHEWISDYGKSPVRVLINIILIVGLFGIILYCSSYGDVSDCIIGSCSAFFTIGLGIGGIEDQFLEAMVISEGAIGFVMMTYFVVVLCDWKKP